MPLNLTEFNQSYIINKICGLEKQRHYLESLGFVPGAKVSLLSELHGYYVVMVKGSKIGLEKSLAKKIIVYAS
ncbi:FeoA family protein [Fusicatenibacter sp.]